MPWDLSALTKEAAVTYPHPSLWHDLPTSPGLRHPACSASLRVAGVMVFADGQVIGSDELQGNCDENKPWGSPPAHSRFHTSLESPGGFLTP